MNEKTNLTIRDILNKEFKINSHGYDVDDVDNFLDLVISEHKDLNDKIIKRNDYIAELETKINALRKDASKLELEKARYEERFKNIKDDQKVSLQNVEYIKRINIYEKKLYELGINPNKLK